MHQEPRGRQRQSRSPVRELCSRKPCPQPCKDKDDTVLFVRLKPRGGQRGQCHPCPPLGLRRTKRTVSSLSSLSASNLEALKAEAGEQTTCSQLQALGWRPDWPWEQRRWALNWTEVFNWLNQTKLFITEDVRRTMVSSWNFFKGQERSLPHSSFGSYTQENK